MGARDRATPFSERARSGVEFSLSPWEMRLKSVVKLLGRRISFIIHLVLNDCEQSVPLEFPILRNIGIPAPRIQCISRPARFVSGFESSKQDYMCMYLLSLLPSGRCMLSSGPSIHLPYLAFDRHHVDTELSRKLSIQQYPSALFKRLTSHDPKTQSPRAQCNALCKAQVTVRTKHQWNSPQRKALHSTQALPLSVGETHQKAPRTHIFLQQSPPISLSLR